MFVKNSTLRYHVHIVRERGWYFGINLRNRIDVNSLNAQFRQCVLFKHNTAAKFLRNSRSPYVTIHMPESIKTPRLAHNQSIWHHDILVALPMKSASLTHIPHSDLSISVVSTRHKYLPNIDLIPAQARTPSVCRVVVTMMGKLHLQVIRDVDIFVFICTSSSRLAVRQLKAAFTLSRTWCKNIHVIIM